jgi:hypothetical protein
VRENVKFIISSTNKLLSVSREDESSHTKSKLKSITEAGGVIDNSGQNDEAINL